MSPEAKQLLERALHLEDDERAEIAGFLFESLEASEPEDEVERAWQDEVERRAALLDEGVTHTVPWEEVRRTLFRKRHGPQNT